MLLKEQEGISMAGYNEDTDILETLSSLNNHEVFTPPTVARQMLDLLPSEVWKNPYLKFLDPCAKTGVFLREIMVRLNDNLPRKNEFGEDYYCDGNNLNNPMERLYHIRRNMLYAIATSNLTAQITRRVLYGVTVANSDKDKACGFKGLNDTYNYKMWNDYGKLRQRDGNVFYGHNNPQHDFDLKGKCKICRMSREASEEDTESYAYPFIHGKVSTNIQKIRSGDMRFDVIIGNPPYQISDGGGNGSSAIPLYHKFIELALSIKPMYISMITPSRWVNGGKGLDKFRKTMFSNKHLVSLQHYTKSRDLFPSVDIEGGVSFFLIDRSKNTNLLETLTIDGNNEDIFNIDKTSPFIIMNRIGVSVFEKVSVIESSFLSTCVLARNPFGISSNSKHITDNDNSNTLIEVATKRFKIKYINKKYIIKHQELIGKYNVVLSKLNGAANNNGRVIGNPEILGNGQCCTDTYLVLKSYDNLDLCLKFVSFVKTKFFRFMVSLKKTTNISSRKSFCYTPDICLSEEWTDEKLYAKYNLTQEEINYIESTIKEMK